MMYSHNFVYDLFIRFHESSQSTTKVDDINIFLSYFQAHPDTAALVQEIE